MQNNKTCFFYVLYSDKTLVSDQSERAQGPIYILNKKSVLNSLHYTDCQQDSCYSLFGKDNRTMDTANNVTCHHVYLSSMERARFQGV